jgi:hypothetical protein
MFDNLIERGKMGIRDEEGSTGHEKASHERLERTAGIENREGRISRLRADRSW